MDSRSNIFFPPSSGSRANLLAMLALIASAVVQLYLVGFRYGESNNLFHIPLVLRLDQLPAFHDDAYYQTLGNFTSSLWWLLRQFADESLAPPTFLILHIAGRIATIIVFWWLLAKPLPEIRLRLLALLIATWSPSLWGTTEVGNHGLFVDYLSHTEFAWPFLLGCLACGDRGHVRSAAVLAALTFSLNAFVGIWCCVALATGLLIRRPWPPMKSMLQAAVLFAITAAPILAWIVHASLIADVHDQSFSFRDYIRNYYPNHFLIEAASPSALINLAAMTATALIACRWMKWTFWTAVIAGFSAIFLIGIPLPYLFDNRFVFNLHLLRVDGPIHMLSVPLILLAGLRHLSDTGSPRTMLSGAVMTTACITGQYLPALFALVVLHGIEARTGRAFAAIAATAVLAALIRLDPQLFADFPDLVGVGAFSVAAILLSFHADARGTLANDCAAMACFAALSWLGMTQVSMGFGTLVQTTVILTCVLALRHAPALVGAIDRIRSGLTPERLRRLTVYALSVCLVATQIVSFHREHLIRQEISDVGRDWIEMVDWVRANPVTGPVLIPLSLDMFGSKYEFQLNSRTPVWVDWPQGSAVMWSPSFHQTWRPRFESVRKLRSPEDFLNHAIRHRIPAVLLEIDGHADVACGGANEAHRNTSFVLCSLAPVASSAMPDSNAGHRSDVGTRGESGPATFEPATN